MSSAFFYGTLMHPKILKRVLQNDGDHLTIAPAILPDHTRHHVAHADYPGVVPYTSSKILFDHDLDEDEKSVRGTLIAGLTQYDLYLLDVFEGDEYVRNPVPVHPLGPLTPLNAATTPKVESSIVPTSVPPLPPPSELSETVQAQTYIWCKPITQLRKELWSYETFVKENASKWIGAGAADNKDYAEVDRRTNMGEWTRNGRRGEGDADDEAVALLEDDGALLDAGDVALADCEGEETGPGPVVSGAEAEALLPPRYAMRSVEVLDKRMQDRPAPFTQNVTMACSAAFKSVAEQVCARHWPAPSSTFWVHRQGASVLSGQNEPQILRLEDNENDVRVGAACLCGDLAQTCVRACGSALGCGAGEEEGGQDEDAHHGAHVVLLVLALLPGTQAVRALPADVDPAAKDVDALLNMIHEEELGVADYDMKHKKKWFCFWFQSEMKSVVNGGDRPLTRIGICHNRLLPSPACRDPKILAASRGKSEAVAEGHDALNPYTSEERVVDNSVSAIRYPAKRIPQHVL
ncbi:hypothetical protein EWM64_g1177 [Hericium alpestre]|uniref:Putative gamma-glutamylcyclotransferase n=1 Tax=Hericium alpestre TaxID=135208 RepID=A0A4Z0A987_9AGAM|nr:hypothetical protein EWM64_g1177 [Hericium alpestre]